MSGWNLPWEGGCRCGEVRLKITAAPILTMACHCTGCQRMSASAYSLSAAIPSAGFEVTQGTTVLGGLRKEINHHFCASCKSWMFTKVPNMEWFVNLRPTMLDNPSWFRPFLETYTSEKLPWATTPAKHSFEKFPTMEDYQRLTQEFEAWAAETLIK